MTMSPTTTTQLKTKAERALVEQFEAALPGLPGGETARSARRAAMAAFDRLGLPHRRVEEWKYTDLRAALRESSPPASVNSANITPAAMAAALGPLATFDCQRIVFVDGRFAAALSTTSDDAGIRISTTSGKDILTDGDGSASDAIMALNSAFATDGAMIDIGAGVDASRPIMIVSLATAAVASSITTRHMVSIGSGAIASLVEVHVQVGKAAVQANSVVELRIGDKAVVDHVKIVRGAGEGVHLSRWAVRLGAETIYRPAQLTPGCGLARHEINVDLVGAGAKLDFAGIALGRASNHIDTTMVIHHIAPGCESRELFKTILDDNARSVFQGKVIVDKDAQKTDGKQMAKALMLSGNAEFDSKPELEIYADDVACGHGSTCAEIEPDLIFYCMSRGIPEAQARALLLESFVGEAIEKVQVPDLRRALSEIASAWLTGKTD